MRRWEAQPPWEDMAPAGTEHVREGGEMLGKRGSVPEVRIRASGLVVALAALGSWRPRRGEQPGQKLEFLSAFGD